MPAVKKPKSSVAHARLAAIKEDILSRNVCPELAAGATQLVFGDGNPGAEVVFVGEAPGKNEDQQGLPFVGAAGQFLNEMLAGIGLARSDVYITNIVKYRPPDNRDPYPEEKAAFLPFLKKQLLAIDPKLIVTLGRHSMETLLPGLRISECHGRPKRVKILAGDPGAGTMQGADEQAVATWVILPLFHPAAALYNAGLRQTLIDDFALIPAILKKIDQENLNKAF